MRPPIVYERDEIVVLLLNAEEVADGLNTVSREYEVVSRDNFYQRFKVGPPPAYHLEDIGPVWPILHERKEKFVPHGTRRALRETLVTFVKHLRERYPQALERENTLQAGRR
jgi:hypothetical protein